MKNLVLDYKNKSKTYDQVDKSIKDLVTKSDAYDKEDVQKLYN
jgi:hypothetical protein